MCAAPRVEESWLAKIGPEFEKPYMKELRAFLLAEKAQGHAVYPRGEQMFAALNATRFDSVRVVILGQDPYHGPGQAMGLSFSVPEDVPPPPSLQNIYKEIADEYGTAIPRTGDLSHWAGQGVLLLNATLSVRAGQAGSHQNKGWEQFTDAVIRALNDGRENLVFMLWGSYAQKKGAFIDRERHLVLCSPHPSPLSAHRGFLGNGHFKKADAYLAAHGAGVIKWVLPH